jgi:hypothetical protein
MVIIKLVNRIPTVVGNASSHQRKAVEGFFDGSEVTTIQYQGSPVWCREDQVKEIESYWDGKYEAPEKVFT